MHTFGKINEVFTAVIIKQNWFWATVQSMWNWVPSLH